MHDKGADEEEEDACGQHGQHGGSAPTDEQRAHTPASKGGGGGSGWVGQVLGGWAGQVASSWRRHCRARMCRPPPALQALSINVSHLT